MHIFLTSIVVALMLQQQPTPAPEVTRESPNAPANVERERQRHHDEFKAYGDKWKKDHTPHRCAKTLWLTKCKVKN